LGERGRVRGLNGKSLNAFVIVSWQVPAEHLPFRLLKNVQMQGARNSEE
jgi:hypothetical protein